MMIFIIITNSHHSLKFIRLIIVHIVMKMLILKMIIVMMINIITNRSSVILHPHCHQVSHSLILLLSLRIWRSFGKSLRVIKRNTNVAVLQMRNDLWLMIKSVSKWFVWNWWRREALLYTDEDSDVLQNHRHHLSALSLHRPKNVSKPPSTDVVWAILKSVDNCLTDL